MLVFCVIGVFSLNNSEFDIYLMALFGILGYCSPGWGASRRRCCSPSSWDR